MIEPAREAFLKQARIELNGTQCLTLSPFVVAQNFEDFEQRLEAFAGDITTAFETVRTGLKMKRAEEVRPETWDMERETSRAFVTDRAFHTRLGKSPEERLGNALKEDIGKVQQGLRDLEEPVRLGTVTEKMIQDIENNFFQLLDMTKALPAWYKNTPAEMMDKYDFVFRPTTLEA